MQQQAGVRPQGALTDDTCSHRTGMQGNKYTTRADNATGAPSYRYNNSDGRCARFVPLAAGTLVAVETLRKSNNGSSTHRGTAS